MKARLKQPNTENAFVVARMGEPRFDDKFNVVLPFALQASKPGYEIELQMGLADLLMFKSRIGNLDIQLANEVLKNIEANTLAEEKPWQAEARVKRAEASIVELEAELAAFRAVGEVTKVETSQKSEPLGPLEPSE